MADLQWDKNFALEQAGDDEEILKELLVLFKQSSADDLAKIRAGFEAGDPVAVGDAAHSIKGAAASLGIEAIRKVAYEMEKAGRGGDLEGARVHLPELEDLLSQAAKLA